MLNLCDRKQPVAPVPSDKVQPLHFFENSLLIQGNNMAVSFVFDKVLDAEKLRRALEGWNRLGGRVRRNVSRMAYRIYTRSVDGAVNGGAFVSADWLY